MGVHNLWELLAPVGRRVSVEALGNKKLAIDASIWIVQFMKAMRDDRGDMIRNAHLLGFFRRICKLLFLRVKPVFVFDGATPALKRRTVIARRRQQENARAKIRKTAEKLLLNHLRTRRLEEASAEAHELLRKDERCSVEEREQSKDDQLPLPSEDVLDPGAQSPDPDTGQIDHPPASSCTPVSPVQLQANPDPGSVMGTATPVDMQEVQLPSDVIDDDDDSEEILLLPSVQAQLDPSVLASLPPSMQLNLLVQMREQLVADNRQRFQRVAKAPASFSELQIQAYLKTVAFRREINEVQQAAAGRKVGGVPSTRIASETSREYIFSSAFSGEKKQLELSQRSRSVEPTELSSEPSLQETPYAYSNSIRSQLRSQDYHDTIGECSTSGTSLLSGLPGNSGQRSVNKEGHHHASRLAYVDAHRLVNIDDHEKSERARKGKAIVTDADEEEVSFLATAKPANLRASFVDGGGAGEQSERAKKKKTLLSSGDEEFGFLAPEEPANLEVSFVDDGGVGDREDELFKELVLVNPNVVDVVDNGRHELGGSFDPTESCMDTETAVPNREFQVNVDVTADSDEVEWEDGTEDGAEDMLSHDLRGFFRPHESGPEHDSDNQNGRELLLEGELGGVPIESLVGQPVASFCCNGRAAYVEPDAEGSFVTRNCGSVWGLDSPVVDASNFARTGSDNSDALPNGQQHQHFCSRESEMDISLDGQQVSNDSQQPANPASRQASHGRFSIEVEMLDQEHNISSLNPRYQGPGADSDGLLLASAQAVKQNATYELGSVVSGSNKDVRDAAVQDPHLLDEQVQAGEQVEKQELSGQGTVDLENPANKVALTEEQPEVAIQTSVVVDDVAQSSSGQPSLITSVNDFGVVSGGEKQVPSQSHARAEGQERTGSWQEERAGEQANIERNMQNMAADMEELLREQSELREAQQINERNADSVTGEMFAECQELLQMFGLPYIIAPMEAEAQCAYMDLAGLVDGVVTNDSDVFLFGGENVYKNIFDDRKYVETYHIKDINSELGLTRDKLIQMALLLGSDYTEGVSGIGIVNAIEVVNAFSGEDELQLFKEWLESPDASLLKKIPRKATKRGKKAIATEDEDADKVDDVNLEEGRKIGGRDCTADQLKFMEKHRAVSKNWSLPESFPSAAVLAAYRTPQVDDSKEAFAWGRPDLAALRKVCFDGFGWNQSKADELLLPVLKEYDRHETQLRLDSFYSFNQRFAKIRSTRIQKAVSSITGKRPLDLMDIPLRESAVAEGFDTEVQGTQKQGKGRKGAGTGARGKKTTPTRRAAAGTRKRKAPKETVQPRTLRFTRQSQQVSTTQNGGEKMSSAEELETTAEDTVMQTQTTQNVAFGEASGWAQGDVESSQGHDDVVTSGGQPAAVVASLNTEASSRRVPLLMPEVDTAAACSIQQLSAGQSSMTGASRLQGLELLAEEPVIDVGLKVVPSLRRKKRVLS